MTTTGNVLPPGLKLEQVQDAVDVSGYPLQSVIINRLKADFTLVAEWGFRDRTTDDIRALDLLAQHDLHDHAMANDYRIRPSLILLIECKRSDLPFVFFVEDVCDVQFGAFPEFAGMPTDEVRIKTDDDRSTWLEPFERALGLQGESFLHQPQRCATFSKCVRKGSDLALSGTDAYQGLVLPLRSAAEHFKRISAPRPTFLYFNGFLVVALAVLDAPMIAVEVDDEGNSRLEQGRGSECGGWNRKRRWCVRSCCTSSHRSGPRKFSQNVARRSSDAVRTAIR